MLWQKTGKFSYDDYEESLKQKDYVRAQEYCAHFPDDQNAVICGWYAKYCLLQSKSDTDASFLEEIRIIRRSVVSRGHRRYDKNALYLLGILLFVRPFETEGIEILESVAALNKARKKLSKGEEEKPSKAEKNARLYLEQHYFRKWEDSRQLEDLKRVADCLGHSEVCYLYADLLRKTDGDRLLADKYEFIYAGGCAKETDKATFYRELFENRLDQIESDIRKDIGFIATDVARIQERLGGIEDHMGAMCRMIDELPEKVCDNLRKEFNAFRVQMGELSEQMEDREEAVRFLIEQAQVLDLKNHNAVQELRTLAKQISDTDQDREKRLAQSVDDLKGVVLNNTSLQAIVKEAEAEIDRRFQDRLLENARKSIITALVTLNLYKRLSKKNEPLIEYSGVVILAATALEMELQERLYSCFKKYAISEMGESIFTGTYRKNLTLGSFKFVAGIEKQKNTMLGENEEKQEREDRFKRFISESKYRDQFSTESGSIFELGPDGQLNRKSLKDFDDRLDKLGRIRNKAAHTQTVSLADAEDVCQTTFLSPQEHADAVTKESISLLEWLLNSCIIPKG